MPLKVDGVIQLSAKMQKLIESVPEAPKVALKLAGEELKTKLQANLSEYSHPPGTPRVGGKYPNKVTGNLIKGLHYRVEKRAGGHRLHVYNNAVSKTGAPYPFFLEHGWTTSKGKKVAYPFMKPTLEKEKENITSLIVQSIKMQVEKV